jgi:hypothetical protein
MAVSKKSEQEVQAPAPSPVVVSGDEFSKFTYNVRGFNESLTIRCNGEEELKALRDRWNAVINPPRRKIPYMNSGDTCLVADCGGTMVARTGTNRKTQQPYRFLKCSNNPACQFFAYIETEQNTPEQNGQNGNGKGAGNEQRAVEAAPAASGG